MDTDFGVSCPLAWSWRLIPFKKGTNGQIVFPFDGTVRVGFSDFRFLSPDHVKAHSFLAGPGSYLDPFLKIQAMATTAVPRAAKSGSAPAVSSINDTFSHSYSIRCNPAGQAFSFE